MPPICHLDQKRAIDLRQRIGNHQVSGNPMNPAGFHALLYASDADETPLVADVGVLENDTITKTLRACGRACRQAHDLADAQVDQNGTVCALICSAGFDSKGAPANAGASCVFPVEQRGSTRNFCHLRTCEHHARSALAQLLSANVASAEARFSGTSW